MKAHARSLRIAPKKANLVARMVRGMPVPQALEALRLTHKKAARMIEKLLQSAVANAVHNDKQEAVHLVIRSIVVNQAAAYRRGVPMARGRTRPIRKFLSHISVVLGVQEQEGAVGATGTPRAPKAPRKAARGPPRGLYGPRAPKKGGKATRIPSQRGKNAVQRKGSDTPQGADSTSRSSVSSVSSVPSDSSVSS